MIGDAMEVEAGLGDDVVEHNAAGDGHSQVEEDPLGYNPQLKNTRYDPELRDDRRANKKKLKRRFEHIFDKYEQDFEGIGDEIDIRTGEIVVDNGHLSRMQNEHDVGNKAPQDSVDPSLGTLDDGVAAILSEERTINTLESGHNATDGGSGGEGSSFEDAEDADSSAVEEDDDSATSPFDADESALEDETNIAVAATKSSQPAALRMRSTSSTSSVSDAASHIASSRAPPDDNIFDQVPGLKDSMLNLQSKYKRGETVDPDAIQALGMSIANQLANFISRPEGDKSRRRSKKSKDPSWSFPGLPEDRKRKRRPRSPSPPAEDVEVPPSGKKSIWAPIRHPRQQKRKRMKEREFTQPPEPDDVESSYPPLPGAESSVHFANRTQDGQLRVCANCQSSDSDVWRKGPNGDLCNTCGMYLYRYGLMRPVEPAGDPTAPDDIEGEIDPLERDWWLAAEKANATERKEITKAVGVKNSHFVIEEDALIIQLKEIDLLSWERMATYFPGRSAYALQCRYSKKLHGRAPKARDILLEQGYRGTPDANGIIIFSYTREPFKEEEDELLLKLHDEDKLDFDTVAESLPGRSPEVLEIRYNELVKELLGSRADGPDCVARQRRASREGSYSLTRNARYSAEEDAKIIRLREIDKLSWAKTAEQMEGRNSFSLQKRYIRELCGRHPDSILPPRKAYNRTPTLGATRLDGEISDSSVDLNSMSVTKYTAEEDAMLLDLRETQGLTWEDIDPKMPGRSRKSLKNRYSSLRDTRTPRSPANAEVGGESLPGTQFDYTNSALRELYPQPEAVFPMLMDGNDDAGANSESQAHGSTDDNQYLRTAAQSTTGLLTPEQSFSQNEDDLVLKLRDLESLPWSDIALQLPGKTISSISERYYHFLLPRKCNVSQDRTAKTTQPAFVPAAKTRSSKSAPIKRWTKEENNLLLSLREQGKTWEDIATRLSGRTSTDVRVHYAAIFRLPEQSSKIGLSLLGATTSTSEAPAQRQVANNLQRPSDCNADAVSETTLIVDRPRGRPLMPKPPSESENDTVQASSNCAQSSRSASDNQPATALRQSNTPPREVNRSSSVQIGGLTASRTPYTHAHPYPQTPFTQTQIVRQSSEPTPLPTVSYATPARFNPHGHPYFVHLPATYPLPTSVELPPSKPATAKMPPTKASTMETKEVKRKTNAKRPEQRKQQPLSKPRSSQSKAKAKAKADAATKVPDVTRYEMIDDDAESNGSQSASDSDEESWHESQNESESEVDESDNTEAEAEMPRATMTVDPDSADDELVNDNSLLDAPPEATESYSEMPAVEQAKRVALPARRVSEAVVYDSATPTPGLSSSEEQGRLTEDEQSQLDSEERVADQVAKADKPKTYDITYVKAHPDETFRHRGNGRWIRGSSPPPKPEKRETFDTEYVNAHPDETFHHRGRGIWARGLPPVEESGKYPVREPGHQGKSAVACEEQPVDAEYVKAHPQDVFTHRGHGRYAKVVPPSRAADNFEVPNGAQSNPQPALEGPNDMTIESSELDPSKNPRTGDANVHEDDHTTPAESDENAKAKRPAVSNTQLLVMALEDNAPEPMFLPDIYKFIETKYGYFRRNKNYRNGLRASLSNQPQFAKASKSFKSGWILLGSPESQHVDQAAGVTARDVPLPSSASETRAPTKTDDELIREQLQVEDDNSTLQIDSSELSIASNAAPHSSPAHPAEQMATPGTGNSTLFSHVQQSRSVGRSTPVKASQPVNHRISNIAEIGSRKRVVHTPVREFDNSEDELA